MTLQMIYLGAEPNDGTGTPLRTALGYVNANTLELWAALGGTGTGGGQSLYYSPQSLTVSNLTLSGASSVLATGSILLGLPSVTNTLTTGTYAPAAITVDAYGRVLSASNAAAGAGLGAVVLAASGATLTISGSPYTSSGGTLVIAPASTTNTVASGSYTNAAVTIDGFGRVITASSGTAGFAVQLAASGGTLTVSGSPLTSSGGVLVVAPVSVTNTVASGSYTNSAITVDGFGRVITASSGSAGGSSALTVSSSSNGGTVTLNYSSAQVFRLTATAATTITFSNWPASGSQGQIELVFIQDSTGARTLTVTGSVRWASGVAPTVATATGANTRLAFITEDGGTTVYGSFVGYFT